MSSFVIIKVEYNFYKQKITGDNILEYHKIGRLALSGLTLTALLAAGHAHAANVSNQKDSDPNRNLVIDFNNSQRTVQHNTRTYRNRKLYNRMRCSRVYRNRRLYQRMQRRDAHESRDLHRPNVSTSHVQIHDQHSVHYQAETATPRMDNQYIERFSQINQILQAEIGNPYSYGGNGPRTFDCSGLTQYVYHHGVHQFIPRTSEAQRQFCATINPSQVRPGDLAFFGQGSASHVGVYIGNDLMVDAQLRGVVVEPVKAPWWHLINFGRPLVPPSD